METSYSSVPSAIYVDLDAFDSLYHQYHHAVYANILKIVQQQEAAEDLLQEVFMALWENRHKLHADKVSGWLFVTSFNKSLKHLRKKEKDASVSLEQAVLPDSFEEDLLQEDIYSMKLAMVEEAINQLPDRKKEVFKLCRYEGKSYDEVAGMLGISAASVKDYLKQSTRFIKDYIASHPSETSLMASSVLAFYLS